MELIFDEFENLVFQESEIGHNILGEIESLNTFTTQSCYKFANTFYRSKNMIFFFYGKTPFVKIIRLAKNDFFEDIKSRTIPQSLPPKKNREKTISIACNDWR